MALRLTIPRPPIGPDPLRRVRIPKDLAPVTSYGPVEDPEGGGLEPESVERIWRAAERLFRSGVHPCLQLCVRREGEVVLDRSLGWTGRDQATVATTETPFCIFSASKSVTATVVHLLGEQGALHVDDRVSEYIPEFAANGKDAITIQHVLSHRSGVPNVPPEAMELDMLDHPERILGLLVDAKPMTRPGKLLAYHAISGGFILGEVVRRVTGKGIREVLQEEILDPLGFRWGNYGVAPADVPLVGRSEVTGARTLPPLSLLLSRALGRPADEITEVSNDPRFLTGVIPAGNVVTTANELSRFFELLRAGGELDGVRILEPRTIRRAIVERSWMELDLSLGAPMRHSDGFMLGARYVSLFGPDTELAFGHLGFTNVLGWADPERGISVGLVTSGKPTFYPEMVDFWGLCRRIGLEAPKVERNALEVATLDPH